MTTTVSSRGQIVLPKKVRASKNIKTGDDLEVITPEGSEDIILRKLARRPNEGLMTALRKLRGLEIPVRGRQPGRNVEL